MLDRRRLRHGTLALALLGLCGSPTRAAAVGAGGDALTDPPRSAALATVSVSGTGSGRVVSSPAGIDCTITNGVATGACLYLRFAAGTLVTLTQTAAAGHIFSSWSGVLCSAASCSFIVPGTGVVNVRVAFSPVVPVNILAAGTGSGRVVSTPLGIDCTIVDGVLVSAPCFGTFVQGSPLTLAATPAPPSAGFGNSLVGFSGGCVAVNATCSISSIAGNVSVTVTFAKTPLPGIGVAPSGSGSGRITSAPAGIYCVVTAGVASGTCATTAFAPGTVLTLTQTVATGSSFVGWTGAGCASAATTCDVTVPASGIVTVTAGFAALVTLTVAPDGLGDGRVTSAPAGIDCTFTRGVRAGACATSVAEGLPIVLTATAAPAAGGRTFTVGGFSGGCTSAGTTCALDSIVGNRTVSVSFGAATAAEAAVSVLGDGTGSGRVTSAPAGIECVITAGAATGVCAALFPIGSTVTLTQTTGSRDLFTGWRGGPCASADPSGGPFTGASCTVTVSSTGSTTVAATFARLWTLTVSPRGRGSGTIISNPVGIVCTLTNGVASGLCAASFAEGVPVTLTATVSNVLSRFDGWEGACTGAATSCVVTLSDNEEVIARISSVVPTGTIRIVATGTGSGRVTSSPPGIACTVTNGVASNGAGSVCSAEFDIGTVATLTVTEPAGQAFAGWDGPCKSAGLALTCQVVVVSGVHDVVVTFNVLPSVARAVDDLFDGRGLSADDRALLDLLGNGDGEFNLGDVLALLDRTGQRLGSALMSRLLALPGDLRRSLDAGGVLTRDTTTTRNARDTRAGARP